MSGPVPVAEAYAAWASSYDAQDNRTRDLDATHLRSVALPLDGASVIEFGAGTGKNTAYLATRAARVLALDLSAAMLGKARGRRLGAHVDFVEHDITLPWPAATGQADLVIGNLVLEHVADLSPIYAEARRVLRAGGLLYVSELHPYRQLQGGVARYRGPDGEVPVEAYLHRTADYVRAGLDSGFSLIDLAEVADPDAAANVAPRLLQLLFEAR